MRRILLDTQAFVVSFLGGKLPPKAQALLADSNVERLLSTASLLEIAIKNTLGKIAMSEVDASDAVRDLRLTLLPVTPQHAYEVFRLPPFHRDPFDRTIIATALVEDIPVIAGDREFKRYRGLKVIWA